jgi:hypothetical protein
MTNILLLAILVTQLAVLVMLRAILKQNDFTAEDASVKAMTGAVAEATSELPPTPKQGE